MGKRRFPCGELQGETSYGTKVVDYFWNQVGGKGTAVRIRTSKPNPDGFMTVRKIVGHELDWQRRLFIFVPPNLLGGSNLFTALGMAE